MLRAMMHSVCTSTQIVASHRIVIEILLNPLFFSGENVNCTRIFTLFALDVLMKAAFGYETNIQNEPNEKFLNSVKNALSVPLWKLAFSMFPFSDHISELLHIQVFRDADYFMDIARTIIASRQKVGSQGRRDLLQLTLQAREEEVAGFPKLSDDELAAQPVAFLIAGFEGTAITLTSPMFNWTSTFPSLCFTFRYMKFGQGTQILEVSINTSEEAIVPVWTEKDNTQSEWKYGQVPIRSMAPFQVIK